MKEITLKKGARVFSRTLWRYLWYTGKVTRNGLYVFVDVADEGFALTLAEVEKLQVRR